MINTIAATHHRYLEDESTSSGSSSRDDDSYNALYHSCSQAIHEELTNFGYIAGSILWYGLLVVVIHRCCLKQHLDGAPIYDTQYWFTTATIQFILIFISVVMFFPYPCSIEEQKQTIVDMDCAQHCQQDRYICMAITGIESIIGCYWYCISYSRYTMAQRLSRPTMSIGSNSSSSDQHHTNGKSAPAIMDNGIFSKLPNTDDDDDDVEDGLEMTETSEDTWD